MTALRRKSLAGGLKSLDEKQGLVTAFVASIGNVDQQNDRLMPGCFEETLHTRPHPIVARGHDWLAGAGVVMTAEEIPASSRLIPERLRAVGAGGLLCTMKYALDTENGSEAFRWLSFLGTSAEFSIGYREVRAERDGDGVNLVHAVDLYEVSDVLAGAGVTALVGMKGLATAKAQADHTSLLAALWAAGDGDLALAVESDLLKSLIAAEVASA